MKTAEFLSSLKRVLAGTYPVRPPRGAKLEKDRAVIGVINDPVQQCCLSFAEDTFLKSVESKKAHEALHVQELATLTDCKRYAETQAQFELQLEITKNFFWLLALSTFPSTVDRSVEVTIHPDWKLRGKKVAEPIVAFADKSDFPYTFPRLLARALAGQGKCRVRPENDVVAAGERLVGVLKSRAARRLFEFHSDIAKKGSVLAPDLEKLLAHTRKPTRAEEVLIARAAVFNRTLGMLDTLFWFAVCEEFPEVNPFKVGVGVKKGWQVVTFAAMEKAPRSLQGAPR